MSKKNSIIMAFPVIISLICLVLGTETMQAAQTMPGIAAPGQANSSSPYLVYFGTITGSKSKGIYAYRFDPDKAQLESIGIVAEMERPTWLAEHPGHQYLYAVSELGNDGKRDGLNLVNPNHRSETTLMRFVTLFLAALLLCAGSAAGVRA